MPFGLCNAPITLSRLMDKAFVDYKAENELELFLMTYWSLLLLVIKCFLSENGDIYIKCFMSENGVI